jgi:hypothetical protein
MMVQLCHSNDFGLPFAIRLPALLFAFLLAEEKLTKVQESRPLLQPSPLPCSTRYSSTHLDCG